MASIKKLKNSLPLKFRLRSRKATSYCQCNNSEKRLSLKSRGSKTSSIQSVESLTTANYIKRATRPRSLPSIIYPPRRKIIEKIKSASDKLTKHLNQIQVKLKEFQIIETNSHHH